MEFVNGHFDNTLTAIDESNIWWSVFSDACKSMDVEYETEIFPGKALVTFFCPHPFKETIQIFYI